MSTENLTNQEAVKKIKELSEKARICMFCTELDRPPANSRPMSLQETDDNGNLWFISSETSNKNFEIKEDRNVQLFFMNNGDSEYLSVYGEAFIYTDGRRWLTHGSTEKMTPMFPSSVWNRRKHITGIPRQEN